MLLDAILEQNRAFVRGRESRPLAAPPTIRAAFVACYDPRLDPLLRPALGLAPEQGFLLRTAGAIARADGDPQRSLALAVHLFGVSEVYVVAHTSCRIGAFSSAEFIDAFRARGVTREAFGDRDLREWAGAFSDPGHAVEGSLRALASSPTLPADLLLGGLLLDDTTGALEVLLPPATAASYRGSSLSPSAAAQAYSPDDATPSSLQAAAPASGGSAPVRESQTPAEPEEDDLADLTRELAAVKEFVATLEGTAGWREELTKLREQIDRQKSPLARVTLVEKFLRRSAVNARGVAVAFERLKREAASGRRSFDPEDLVAVFRRMRRKG